MGLTLRHLVSRRMALSFPDTKHFTGYDDSTGVATCHDCSMEAMSPDRFKKDGQFQTSLPVPEETWDALADRGVSFESLQQWGVVETRLSNLPKAMPLPLEVRGILMNCIEQLVVQFTRLPSLVYSAERLFEVSRRGTNECSRSRVVGPLCGRGQSRMESERCNKATSTAEPARRFSIGFRTLGTAGHRRWKSKGKGCENTGRRSIT